MSNQSQTEHQREKNARCFANYAPLLLQQAAMLLEQRLQQQSQDKLLWFKLGNTYRGLGKLDQARDAFQQAMNYGHEPVLSQYLIKLCEQDLSASLSQPRSNNIPVPFIRRFDLFTEAELAIAWQVLNEHANQFKTSGVGIGEIRETTRRSMLIGGKKFESLRQLFLERIEPTLSQAFDWFGIVPPIEKNYTVQMTTHSDGDFYRIHKDTGSHHHRVLSYIYYFHKQPKVFSGGELQLFDTDTKNDCASTTFTTIEPVHNSLIVFPSEYYHQVCTVNLASEDRLLGRHTINGWLVKAAKV